MIARVVRTEGGRLVDLPFDSEVVNSVVEATIRDRDEKDGVHVHAFAPSPETGRDWWLITWPVELDAVRAAEELHAFALGMLPEEGTIELPQAIGDEDSPYVWATFNQPVVFSKALRADGSTVDDEIRGIGHRFILEGE